MADISLQQLNQLFDKLTQLGERVNDGFAQMRHDSLKTNERITHQAQRFHEDMTRLNNRLDLVAAQVATIGDEVAVVKELGTEQSQVLERIERRLNKDLDRLDDHGARIEALEAKTEHLPSPPTGR